MRKLKYAILLASLGVAATTAGVSYALDVFGDISKFITKYASEFDTLVGMSYWDNTYTFNLMCSYL